MSDYSPPPPSAVLAVDLAGVACNLSRHLRILSILVSKHLSILSILSILSKHLSILSILLKRLANNFFIAKYSAKAGVY